MLVKDYSKHVKLYEKRQLSSWILSLFVQYDKSNKIITKLVLNKLKKDLVYSDDYNTMNAIFSRNRQKKKSKRHGSYYFNITMIKLFDTKFFKTYKHYLVPSFLLVYLIWRESTIRQLTNQLCNTMFGLCRHDKSLRIVN
jgi:hypothetical protein